MMILYLICSSSANSFSSVSSANSTSAMSTQNIEGIPTNEESSRRGEEGRAEALQDPPNEEEFSGGSIDTRNVPFGFHGDTAILPEVHTVTGEFLVVKLARVVQRAYKSGPRGVWPVVFGESRFWFVS